MAGKHQADHGQLCHGLLAHALEEEINIVNAEVLLRERGIELVEQRHSDIGELQLTGAGRSRNRAQPTRRPAPCSASICCGSFSSTTYRLDAYLDGVLMVFTHHDVPGIIGTVGTIFGRHKINIAQMAVGRETKGGEAIGVLNLDQARRPPRWTKCAVIRRSTRPP